MALKVFKSTLLKCIGYKESLAISYLKRRYHNEISKVKLFKIEMNNKQKKKIFKEKAV